MDINSTKQAFEEAVKTIKFTDALKLSETTKRLMEDFNKMPKIPDIDLTRLESLPPRQLIQPPSQQEINKYQSASALMEALSKEALRWKQQLPPNYQPTIMAILYGGIQINVRSLAQVSFHGIQIQGTLNGAHCSMLAHQSTVQMLCYAEEVTEEIPNRTIGFIWPDHDVQV